jgi:hypothetical protein
VARYTLKDIARHWNLGAAIGNCRQKRNAGKRQLPERFEETVLPQNAIV